MILDTSISVALKDEFGKYDIKNINLFQINEANSLFKFMKIKLNNKNTVMISFRCPLCGKWHTFNCCISNVISQELVVCGCKTLGMPVLFAGSNGEVKARVRQYNKINKDIYAIFQNGNF